MNAPLASAVPLHPISSPNPDLVLDYPHPSQWPGSWVTAGALPWSLLPTRTALGAGCSFEKNLSVTGESAPPGGCTHPPWGTKGYPSHLPKIAANSVVQFMLQGSLWTQAEESLQTKPHLYSFFLSPLLLPSLVFSGQHTSNKSFKSESPQQALF